MKRLMNKWIFVHKNKKKIDWYRNRKKEEQKKKVGSITKHWQETQMQDKRPYITFI